MRQAAHSSLGRRLHSFRFGPASFRGVVLALLMVVRDQSSNTRAIAREVGGSIGAVQPELENLSKVGLILRKPVGSQFFIKLTETLPSLRQTRTLTTKTLGTSWRLGVLRSVLGPILKQIVAGLRMDRLYEGRKQRRTMSSLLGVAPD
jgi:hypothetical protein